MCVDAEESRPCDMLTAEGRRERGRERKTSFREKTEHTQHCIIIPHPFESIQWGFFTIRDQFCHNTLKPHGMISSASSSTSHFNDDRHKKKMLF